MSSALGTLFPREIVVGNALTDNNHGAAITIAAGISFGATIVALALRLSQRWPWTTLFGLEDALLVAATVVEIAAVAVLARAVHTGLGRHVSSLSTDATEQTRRALAAGFALTFVVEALATASSTILMQHITPERMVKRISWALIGFVGAWMLAAVVCCAVSSSVAAILDRPMWIAFGATGVLIQLTLLGSFLWLVWPRKMALSKKLTVSSYFGLSLLVAVVIVVRLVYTPAHTLQADYTWNDINMVVIFIVESNLTIIAAAYPAVRGFLTQVSTGLLVPAKKASKGDSKNGSKGSGYALNTIGSSGNASKGKNAQVESSRTWDNQRERHVSGKPSYHAAAVAGDVHSVRSYGSEVIMVRQSVEIEDEEISNS